MQRLAKETSIGCRSGGGRIWRLLGLMALAGAADAARAAEPLAVPPPPPEFSWTGFYVGVHAGAGVDHFGFPFAISVPGPAGGTVIGTSGITAGGPIAGVQAGFNYELPFFHIVAGIEIDNSGSFIRGDNTESRLLPNGASVTADFGTKFVDFGTVRLRLGYAWGRFMPYLTAGFSYGTIETSFSAVGPGFFAAGSSTATRTGVPFVRTGAYGAGVEYAIAPNLTVKAEYLYEAIIARPVLFVPAPGPTVSFNTRTMYHIGRVGLNYKFDWLSPTAAPVVAKY
jgi:outer membrane immunogenic protein